MNSKLEDFLSLTPLGGVGEIGSNMALVQTNKACFLIDAGILFPNDDAFGLDYLIPDLTVLEKVQPTDIFITHGHEDHIGAITHVVKMFPDITIWGSPFCLNLIKQKLKEKGISAKTNTYFQKNAIQVSDLEILPIFLNHSIPETHGFLVKKNDVGFFYASDFKIEFNKLDEITFDQNYLIKELSLLKKRALFIDSTNILNQGKTNSEQEVYRTLTSLIKANKHRRIFITLFASNIFRLNHVITEATNNNLPITIIGKSIHKYIQSAMDCGFINKNISFCSDEEASKNDRGIFILSGCQGDFFSAFRRVAIGEHQKIKLNSRDLFLYSSKVIPGNEKKVYKLFNKIIESGCELITSNDQTIHCSGHPGQEDIRFLLNPFNFHCDYFPIHGESIFLAKHCEFITQNFPILTPHFILNSDTIVFNPNSNIKIKKNEISLPILIHNGGIEIEREKIGQRRKIASRGLFIVCYSLKDRTIKLEYIGLPSLIDNHTEIIKEKIWNYIDLKKHSSSDSLNEEIRIFSMKLLELTLGFKPVTKVFSL